MEFRSVTLVTRAFSLISLTAQVEIRPILELMGDNQISLPGKNDAATLTTNSV